MTSQPVSGPVICSLSSAIFPKKQYQIVVNCGSHKTRLMHRSCPLFYIGTMSHTPSVTSTALSHKSKQCVTSILCWPLNMFHRVTLSFIPLMQRYLSSTCGTRNELQMTHYCQTPYCKSGSSGIYKTNPKKLLQIDCTIGKI